MPTDKIEKLEQYIFDQQKILSKIEGALEGIQSAILNVVGLNDTVISHKEKLKSTESRLKKIEEHMVDKELYNKLETKVTKQQEAINGINLKIAMVSGGWTVIIYLISKM